MSDPQVATAQMATAMEQEWTRVSRDAAIVDVGAWQVVVANGNDRLTFLHRLLTAGLEGLSAGQGRSALLLNIKGHVVAEFRVCVRPDDVWLLVPPGQGEAAAAALARYAIMDDVTLVLQPSFDVLAVYGPAVTPALAAAGVEVPPALAAGDELGHVAVLGSVDGNVGVPGADLELIKVSGLGSMGFWLVGDRARLATMAARLRANGVGQVDAELADGLRIAAGEPKFGVEITPEVFPMEVGLDGMIDYGKGCYLGQEPIVRIRDRGRTNRHLVSLRLPDDVVVTAGDAIETDERPKAGRVTSAGRLAAGPVALAMVHVSVPMGATVRIRHGEDSVAAEVIALRDGGAAVHPAGPATP